MNRKPIYGINIEFSTCLKGFTLLLESILSFKRVISMATLTLVRATSEDLQRMYQDSKEESKPRTLVANQDLSNQEITLPDLECIDFVHTDLTNTVLRGCDLRGSTFEHAVLSHTRLIDCCLGGCTFPDEALLQNSAMIEFQNCQWSIVGKA